jgi:hypothetical protein
MSEPSGRAWCPRFSTSASVSDLAEPFRTAVSHFLAALKVAGASVAISATYRPPERAYLMHWAWLVGNGMEVPASVPPMAGVDIDWTHGGDLRAAVQSAREMISAYGLLYKPSLNSRHCERQAIDMRVSWDGVLNIRNARGTLLAITSSPRNGENRDLQAVAREFGVVKLVSDPPHWSNDGH